MPQVTAQYAEQVSAHYFSKRIVRDTERNPMDISVHSWLGPQAKEAFTNTVVALGNDTKRINTLVESVVKKTQDGINAASALDNTGGSYLANDGRYYATRDGRIDATGDTKQKYVSSQVLSWLHDNYPASRGNAKGSASTGYSTGHSGGSRSGGSKVPAAGSGLPGGAGRAARDVYDASAPGGGPAGEMRLDDPRAVEMRNLMWELLARADSDNTKSWIVSYADKADAIEKSGGATALSTLRNFHAHYTHDVWARDDRKISTPEAQRLWDNTLAKKPLGRY